MIVPDLEVYLQRLLAEYGECDENINRLLKELLTDYVIPVQLNG